MSWGPAPSSSLTVMVTGFETVTSSPRSRWKYVACRRNVPARAVVHPRSPKNIGNEALSSWRGASTRGGATSKVSVIGRNAVRAPPAETRSSLMAPPAGKRLGLTATGLLPALMRRTVA